jgi:hypothetical protein
MRISANPLSWTMAATRAALKPGGTYVAAMGCHKDRAVWPRWRKVLAETSTPSCR